MMSVFTLPFSLLSLKAPKTTLVVLLRFVLFFEEVRVFFLGLLFLELRAACHFFTMFRRRLDTIMFLLF